MNRLKYKPRKVYVKEDGKYKELEYEEFCRIRETDKSNADKKFIPAQACLVEADERTYKEYYRERERNKYINRIESKQQLRSLTGEKNYHKDEEGFEGDKTYLEACMDNDVEPAVITKLMIEKLNSILPLLSADERRLISDVFYRNKSQTEIAREQGIRQSTIEYRLKRVLEKLRKQMERF